MSSSFASALPGAGRTSPRVKNIVVGEPNMIERTLPAETLQLHQRTMAAGGDLYEDPETGLTVFTRCFHERRGRCCGSGCRHCPFNHVNVPAERRKVMEQKFAPGATTAIDTAARAAKAAAAATIAAPSSSSSSSTAGPMTFAGNSSMATPCCADAAAPAPPAQAARVAAAAATVVQAPAGESKVYTRTGDKGTSGLYTGARRAKNDAVFEALGTLDELSSNIGVARADVAAARGDLGAEVAADVDAVLEWVQQRLMDCCTAVASPSDVAAAPPGAPEPVIASWAPLLEGHIDRWTATLPPLWAFIVPYGGRRCSASLHVCRTVCRRAERRVVDVADAALASTRYAQEVRAVGVFVNRLSDFLFTAARLVSASEVERDVKVPT